MSAIATVPEKPVRRFPPPCWTQDEALALIQAYRERWYALRRGYLRTADWDAVAEEIGKVCPGATPPKTSAQCRHKMEKLRQRYRAEKQRALSFPGGQFLSTWFYFEAMEAMEKNGTGSNPDEEESQPGIDLKIVNSKIDSVHGGLNLNPGRGIRFKPVSDSNLVTIAARSNNFRASHNYSAQIEDNDEEFEDRYYIESQIGKNLGKPHKSISQNDPHPSNFQDLDQQSGVIRPRKFSKTGSNSNHSYWNENGEDQDNDNDNDNDLGEDDVWVKMPKYGENGSKRGIKRDNNDSIGQIVSSIKLLADGFVKMEKMKMDMVHEIEKMRMEAEMKRNEMLLESQKQIVVAFVNGLVENKKQQ